MPTPPPPPSPESFRNPPIDYRTAPPPAQRDMGQDAGMRMLLPVGRSGWAIAAGYLGLLSPLLVFAPFAAILGIVAVVDIKNHPDRHGLGRAWFGIVMGAIFTVALGLILTAALVGR